MINQFMQSYCETPHATESNLHRVEYGAGKPFSRVRTSLLILSIKRISWYGVKRNLEVRKSTYTCFCSCTFSRQYWWLSFCSLAGIIWAEHAVLTPVLSKLGRVPLCQQQHPQSSQSSPSAEAGQIRRAKRGRVMLSPRLRVKVRMRQLSLRPDRLQHQYNQHSHVGVAVTS
jgi:hypothetical protein